RRDVPDCVAAREPVASRRHPTANGLFNGKLPAGAVAGCDHVPRKIKSTEPCAAFRLPCFCELRVYGIADSVRTVLSRLKEIIAERNRSAVAATGVYFLLDGWGR